MSQFDHSVRRRTDNPYDPAQVKQATEHRRDSLEHDAQLRPHVSRLRRLLKRVTRR